MVTKARGVKLPAYSIKRRTVSNNIRSIIDEHLANVEKILKVMYISRRLKDGKEKRSKDLRKR